MMQNGILGMLDLLMDTPLTPEQKDYVATMRRSTNVLLTVISDILDFRYPFFLKPHIIHHVTHFNNVMMKLLDEMRQDK